MKDDRRVCETNDGIDLNERMMMMILLCDIVLRIRGESERVERERER